MKISKIIATILICKKPEKRSLSNRLLTILKSLSKQTTAREHQVDLIALDSCDNIYGTSIQEPLVLHQKWLTAAQSRPI